MFCYQCQEASKGVGCSVKGVCGKTEAVSDLQDLLIYTLKGVARAAMLFDFSQEIKNKASRYCEHGLFATITNANFDEQRIIKLIREGLLLRDDLLDVVREAGISIPHEDLLSWKATSRMGLEAKAKEEYVGVLATENEDIRSLRELIVYGLKGLAAYAEHAENLGLVDPDISRFVLKALADTTRKRTVDELVKLTLETGDYCVKAMSLLDRANTKAYGHPEMTEVRLGVANNPAILISGHDLRDLDQLLKQTEGTGVDVYTHGEMLPAHAYPAFKKYSNFIGNYGNAWWQQKEEFETFNGPILFTTNCIVPPREDQIERIYTTGASGYPGCTHIVEDRQGNKDFSAIIEHAKRLPAPEAIEDGTLLGGFAHAQVSALLDQVVDAVEAGDIKRFFVMAGCDGRHKSRDYYTDFAKNLPDNTVILTAGCAKYRYNKLDLGNINGIPRVLDAGQCNDSYSLVAIAMALQERFKLDDINDLPISYNIAWYEQKAVAVLLGLLSLGVKDIHLGPSLPAFLSPGVVSVLVEHFQIAGIKSVKEDLDYFLNLS